MGCVAHAWLVLPSLSGWHLDCNKGTANFCKFASGLLDGLGVVAHPFRPKRSCFAPSPSIGALLAPSVEMLVGLEIRYPCCPWLHPLPEWWLEARSAPAVWLLLVPVQCCLAP